MSAKQPRGKPFTKGDDPRRKIAPAANTVSLTRIARRFLDMTPSEIASEIGSLREKYTRMGKGKSTMAEIVVASFLWNLANDPQPGNMRELWRRIDGEVSQTVFDVDPSTLTDEQLERIRNGESIESVLADARRSRTGIPAQTDNETEGANVE